MKVGHPVYRPTTRYLGSGLLETTDETVYYFSEHGAQFKLFIPPGFHFDAASIPRLFWTLLGITPQDLEAEALPHDVGYHFQGKLPEGWLFVWHSGDWHETTVELDKVTWDKLLRELCLYFGMSKIKAAMIFSAVYSFGWFAWLRDDKKRKEDKL